MRILMFGMSSYPGGIENYIYNCFVNEDFPQSIKIDFVTYENEIAYESELLQKGYTVHRVPHLKKNPLGYYKKVKSLIKENGYDCIYVNMLTAANVIPVYLAAAGGAKKIILHAHANSTVQGALRKTLHKLNKNYCNKKADLRLACSEQAGKWLYGDNKFYVIANAIDCEKFKFSEANREKIRQELKIEDNEFVIGHIGRLADEKNHFFMLEVLKEFLKRESKTKMIFVGDGYLAEEIKSRTESLGLSDKVIFYGTSNKTNEIYSAFDAFIFPSTFEGFGMAALEAQACGLKCYCSSCLSSELNVSEELEYIPLEDGAEKWAEKIYSQKDQEPDREKMNETIKNSSYNIKHQISKLVRLLNGEE